MSESMKREHTTQIIVVPEAATPERTPQLLVLKSPATSQVGRLLRLEGELVIGRGIESHFLVDDPSVSRRHVRVFVRDGQVQLEDLDSTNGTYVNGVAVRNATLHNGDRIQIGAGLLVKFSWHDQVEERFQSDIYRAAVCDPLTGLFNRKYFTDALRRELAGQSRHGGGLAVVVIDVDDFKGVNDRLGHQAGDQVLVELAERLTRVIRAEDVLARYGGEEFAVLLRSASLSRAMACAERCRAAVAHAAFPHREGAVPLTVSVGVAALEAGSMSPEDLFRAADRALYAAKEAGKNRVVPARSREARPPSLPPA